MALPEITPPATPAPTNGRSFRRHVISLSIVGIVSAVALEMKSPPEKDNLATIAALFAFIAAVLAVLKGTETAAKVESVGLTVSQVDAMLREQAKVSRAEGVAVGKAGGNGGPPT